MKLMEQLPNEMADNLTPEEQLRTDSTGFDELEKALNAMKELQDNGKLFDNEEKTTDYVETDTSKEENTHEEEGNDPQIETTDSYEEGEEETQEEEEDAELQERKRRQQERQTLREQKRKTYAVIQEKREMEARALAAEARVQELDQLLGHSLNSAVHHYSKTIYGNLEKAKQDKQLALDTGDTRQLIEADINLTKAINAVNELEKLENNKSNNSYSPSNAQGAYQPQYQPQPQAGYPPQYNNYPAPPKQQNNYQELHREIAADWLETHPYLQPSSKHYDIGLAQKVNTFVTRLDSELQGMGRMDQYYSDPYFAVIDKFITENKYPVTKGSTRSAATESHIGGVRNSYSASSPSKSSSKQVTLSPEERIMLENMPGISRETYLKYKIQEINNNKKRGNV